MNEDRFILWDFDGTLAHRPGQWTGTLLEILRRSRLDHGIDREIIRPFISAGFPWHEHERVRPGGQSADAWWADLLPVFTQAFRSLTNVDDDRAGRLASEVRDTYLDPAAWSLFDDTIPTLHELSARGWKHVVLSNHVPELRFLIERLGLASHFDAIHSSATTGVEKPNPLAFRQVLAGLPPDCCVWMVGDNPVADIQGAEAVGIPAVLVRNDSPVARRRCPDLRDVIGFLSGA